MAEQRARSRVLAEDGPGARAARLFPIVSWLPRYTSRDARGDLAAGITIGAMLIPQGMAYAQLAGLPPEAGLYASVLPLVAYAVLGGSRHLAVGPTAISSLLAAEGLAHVAGGDVRTYAELAAVLALLVGLMRIAMGVGRLGFVVNFLSRPVLSGFTSAAAVIIAVSQLKFFLGVRLTSSSHVYEVLADGVRHLDDVHLHAMLIGSCSIALLVGFRRWLPSWPGALLVVMLATGAVSLLGLESEGVDVVGDIPEGMPSLTVPRAEADDVRALLPTALAITMLGFVESIAIAKVFAQRHGYRIRPNRELVALGVATTVGGLSQSYPVSGSFSRTAVNADAGARTQMAGIISASVMALALVVLTPLFRPMPNAVLAAVVISAVAGLVDISEARRLWRVKRNDFYLLVVAFSSTLLLGVGWGLATSVVASLLVLVRRTSRPHTAVLGRIPGTANFRNVDRSPDALTTEGIVVLRIDAPLYFANAEFLRDEFRRVEASQDGTLRVFILDASSVSDLDSTADRTLSEIAEDYCARGLHLYFANVKGIILDVMRRSGLYQRLGSNHFFLSTDEAVRSAEALMRAETDLITPPPARTPPTREPTPGRAPPGQ